MTGFFAIDNNILINIDKIDSVEQKTINGENLLVVYIGGREYSVKRDEVRFLEMIRNIGKTEVSWVG